MNRRGMNAAELYPITTYVIGETVEQSGAIDDGGYRKQKEQADEAGKYNSIIVVVYL